MIFHVTSLTLMSVILISCGSSSGSKDTTPVQAPGEPTWDQANQAITASCGGSSCHSSGAPNTPFVGDQALVTSAKTSMLTRISDETMPPAGWSSQFNRDVVVNYLTNTLQD